MKFLLQEKIEKEYGFFFIREAYAHHQWNLFRVGKWEWMTHLNATAPLVNKPVDPYLEELVVVERAMRHHHPVVIVIQGPRPLCRPKQDHSL